MQLDSLLAVLVAVPVVLAGQLVAVPVVVHVVGLVPVPVPALVLAVDASVEPVELELVLALVASLSSAAEIVDFVFP